MKYIADQHDLRWQLKSVENEMSEIFTIEINHVGIKIA